MTSDSISEADPMTTWARLEQDETALLLDVRTQAEWSFVGVPTTPANRPSPVLIEWQEFPAMTVNPTFAEAALNAAEEAGATTVYFICRSGVRSLHAAVAGMPFPRSPAWSSRSPGTTKPRP